MNQRVSVSLLPAHAEQAEPSSDVCAVVIDVLRATTVMTTAGANEASRIITCESIEAARTRARQSTETTLLCGERDCKRIEGFDLGNSPREYSRDRVAGNALILTTTNGTRAINAVSRASRMVIAAFVNLSSIVDAIRSESQLQIVCAGTNGHVTCEDVLLAGAIVHRLKRNDAGTILDDSARIAVATWHEVERAQGDREERLRSALAESLGGRNMIAAGFESDLDWCATIDSVRGYCERTSGTEFRFRADPPIDR